MRLKRRFGHKCVSGFANLEKYGLAEVWQNERPFPIHAISDLP